MYYVYILRCRRNLLYTGITTDIKRRFGEHLGGKTGAKFTRSNPPDSVEAVWSCENRSLASKLEYAVKKLNKRQKLTLISDITAFSELLGDEFTNKYKRENTQINL